MKMLIINTSKEQNIHAFDIQCPFLILFCSPLLPPTDESFQSDRISLGYIAYKICKNVGL